MPSSSILKYIVHLKIKYKFNKYYPKDYFFNRLVLKTFNISKYTNVHKSKKGLSSDTDITFDNDINFGDSPFSIWRKLGNSSFKYERKGDYRHKILLYKLYIGNYKTKIEYHFFNKQLFFITYTFPDLNDYSKLKNMIKNKYLDDTNINLEDHKIMDRNNNILYLDTSMEFTLNYFTGNEYIIDHIEGKLSDIKKKVEEQLILSDKILFERI